MSVNSINTINNTAAYTAATEASTARSASTGSKAAKAEDTGVVYEKNSRTASSTIYSKEDVVARLKSDAEARTSQMKNLVQQMMSQQGVRIGQADDMWKFLASGNYTVSADVKAQAQADIAEDGYWGVKQTSERIFEFAKALAGGDAEKMEEMRSAVEKGFKLATKSWGSELPSISKDTYDAVMKKFDDWAGITDEEA